MLPVILFYILSGITILSSFAVISSRDPVRAVLFLILAFFNAAGLFVLLGAELVAMLLVIVYVGAVAVLFLFVVMMLNINIARMKDELVSYAPLGILIAILLFVELFFIIEMSLDKSKKLYEQPIPVPGELTNAESIGMVLYTDYAYPFQLAGLILLVAMIGAITLAHRKREGVKRQKIEEQLLRDKRKTVRLVSVKKGEGV